LLVHTPFYDNCDPRDQKSTQPSEPSVDIRGKRRPSLPDVRPRTGSVRKLAKTTIPFGQLSDDDDRDECNLRTAIEAR